MSAMIIAGCGHGDAADTTAPVKAEENAAGEKNETDTGSSQKKKKDGKTGQFAKGKITEENWAE